MPLSWEIKRANQILIGILHVDGTTVAWSFGLRNILIPGRDEHRKFYPFIPLSGMPYDHARNTAAMECLKYKADWLGFLDSDVIPPRDAFVRLMAHQQPIVSGLYCRRSPPHAIPVAIKNGQWLTQFPANAVIEVDLVGAGCLLIHRSVLERMPFSDQRRGKRWFDWRVDMAGLVPQGEALSEDFTLCANARKLGYKVLLDTSIVCRHIGMFETGVGTAQPLQCNPIT